MVRLRGHWSIWLPIPARSVDLPCRVGGRENAEGHVIISNGEYATDVGDSELLGGARQSGALHCTYQARGHRIMS
jgi:hypothetical protein